MTEPPARVLLLLCARLDGTEPAPLSGPELDRLLGWLKRAGLTPAVLFDRALVERLLRAAATPPLPAERLLALLDRDAALDAALAGWAATGVWVVGRHEPDYPRRLKRRLRRAAPPLLFGRGPRAALGRGGIALAGGNGTDPDATGFAARFAARAAADGLALVSGNRGPVETAALLGCLENGGLAVLVADHGPACPEALREAAGRAGGRAGGRTAGGAAGRDPGGLLLLSPHEPDRAGAPVEAGCCLHALSDATLLVGLERDDPAWRDAAATVEADWMPCWVRPQDAQAPLLHRLGARPLQDPEAAPRSLLRAMRAPSCASAPQGDAPPAIAHRLVPVAVAPAGPGFAEAPAPFGAPPGPDGGPGRRSFLRLVPGGLRPGTTVPAALPTLFELFGRALPRLLETGPLGVTPIADALQLIRPQAEAWLLRAEAEKLVRRDPATRLYHLC